MFPSLHRRLGQTIVEYLVILVLVGVALIPVVQSLRRSTRGVIREAKYRTGKDPKARPPSNRPNSRTRVDAARRMPIPYKVNNRRKPNFWKIEYNPEKNGPADRYEPAKLR
ncbi:MAG: hypothetical protein D6805_08045 [Planctomycetota bacterium]|nr:MAG: hypothetical protein D6805_08045 [Planctomycetota bacterium]